MWVSVTNTHSVQFSHSVVSDSATPWTAARQVSLLITNSQFTQIHVHWVGDAIQPSHPLSSPSPPASIFPSIRVFSNESALRIRWPKYCRFGLNISPSNEHPGLISFRMDGLDLLAVQQLQSIFFKNMKCSSIWERFGSLFYLTLVSFPVFLKLAHIIFIMKKKTFKISF